MSTIWTLNDYQPTDGGRADPALRRSPRADRIGSRNRAQTGPPTKASHLEAILGQLIAAHDASLAA